MNIYSILVAVLKYALPLLNVAFIVWMILMNHAYVHPTSMPISYAFRSHGSSDFRILTIILCAVAVAIGLGNIFIIHHIYQSKPNRWNDFKRNLTFYLCPRARLYIPVVVLVFLLVGSYGIVSSLVFRGMFAKKAYVEACDGYALMAEVEVLPGFGYDGTNSSMVGPSSRIRFFKDGKYKYTMDLIRHYRMSLGFNQYRRGSAERARFENIPEWGMLNLELVMNDRAGGRMLGANSTERYFNATNSDFMNVLRGRRNTTAPGPIGGVSYDLRRSTYDATYSNTTSFHRRGTFDILPRNLTFPGLGLSHAQEKEEWRFTDHVCLPPRVSLGDLNRLTTEDIRGEMSLDCMKYRICALKRAYRGSEGEESVGELGGEGDGWREWWDWIENIWPVVTGVVAWEVERYSACCVRKE